MKIRAAVAALAIVLLHATSAWAAAYYVDGRAAFNGAGTVGSPYKCFVEVLKKVRAGDTVYVAHANYRSTGNGGLLPADSTRDIYPDSSGRITSGNTTVSGIVFRGTSAAATGWNLATVLRDSVIITKFSAGSSYIIGQYMKCTGVNFTYADTNRIAKGNRFERGVISTYSGTGITFAGASNCKVYDVTMTDSTSKIVNMTAYSATQGVVTRQSTADSIIGCTITDTGVQPYHGFYTELLTNNCVVDSNTITLTFNKSSVDGVGVAIYDTYNCYFRYNTVTATYTVDPEQNGLPGNLLVQRGSIGTPAVVKTQNNTWIGNSFTGDITHPGYKMVMQLTGDGDSSPQPGHVWIGNTFRVHDGVIFFNDNKATTFMFNKVIAAKTAARLGKMSVGTRIWHNTFYSDVKPAAKINEDAASGGNSVWSNIFYSKAASTPVYQPYYTDCDLHLAEQDDGAWSYPIGPGSIVMDSNLVWTNTAKHDFGDCSITYGKGGTFYSGAGAGSCVYSMIAQEKNSLHGHPQFTDTTSWVSANVNLGVLSFASGSRWKDSYVGAAALDQINPGAVTDLVLQGFGSNWATFAWTARGQDGDAGKVAGYDVRWSTSPSFAWAGGTSFLPSVVTYTPGTTNGTLTAANLGAPLTRQYLYVSGLTEGVTYYVKLKSSDAAGNLSAESNEVHFTTLTGSDVMAEP